MVRGRGCGIDVPVWVEREEVDLKICMYDRLYQDAILVHNRYVILHELNPTILFLLGTLHIFMV
jgi:hypothetical protein